MPRFLSRHFLLASLLSLLTLSAVAQEATLPVSYEPDTGRVLLELTDPDRPMLYTNTLAAGVGTTETLLDRGQLGVNAVVHFERHGDKVLLIQENSSHRSLDGSPASRRAVRESFPRSVLAALPIESENGEGLVVDATDFILSDVFNVAGRLDSAELGQATLDRDRSHVVAGFTDAFPENSEIRAALTFTVKEASDALERHAPDARSLSVEQHHSFIALPDEGYRPRAFHPQAGVFPHILFDFNQGHDSDYRRRWIWRWRLVPSDRKAYLDGELVEPESPIVYYLDPAIPEPYRSAFREGGEWWNQAFEAAGFRNAFQIRDLPEDADPMDARYNVIHWVHRQQRGPSIGPHYRDPRTGEIVRSIVRMDSFRSLVNHDIWMGFRPAAGPEGPEVDSEAMAMARRRQHSAHEIGHTLGLAHNFIAASQNRASVMDYPVPLARLDEDGHVDLSDAYAEGVGEHDRLAIRYAYTWYPDAEAEREGLREIMAEFDERDVRFITGSDAGVAGSIPAATTWVEGNDMFSALERTRAVRRALIEAFDERALNPGEPYFLLNKRFAHVYLHHRTALQGVTKHIGGMDYRYAMQGEETAPTQPVSAANQRRALEELLDALDPAALRVPESVSELIAPEPFGWGGGWQWHVDEAVIESPGGPAFDPLHLAHSLAREITDNLLHPQRMARVDSFSSRHPELPDVDEVLDALIEATWERSGEGETGALLRRTQRAALDSMLDLAGNDDTTAPVRAVVEARLEQLAEELEEGWLPWRRADRDTPDAVHRHQAQRDIERYFDGRDDPDRRAGPEPVALPWP